MKFFKKTITLKKKITLTSFFLVCGILLNAYSNFNVHNFTSFFADLTATISVDKTTVCKDGVVSITLEAENGTAPYTFTYELNDDAPIIIKTTSGNSVNITLDGSVEGIFKYKLTKVEDSGSPILSVDITDEEKTITVTTPPVASFGITNNDSCSDETVTFTNTSTGEELSYFWEFGDGETSTLENPNYTYKNLLGCDKKTFTVKLTVTDKYGCNPVETSKTVTVLEKPDIEFFDSSFNNFNNCGNASTSYTVNIDNNSKSDCINNFLIDWGDGNTESSMVFPIDHTYNKISVFNLKIKAIGENGCVNEVSYVVKNVSNPAGGLASPGSTSNICLIDSELTFPITNYENNSDDTTYTIDFGDGSSKEKYTHTEITNNNQLTHKYIKGSCSSLNNQFIAVLSIENACSITESTINNIVVLEPSISKFESTDTSCINKSLTFINSSSIGDNPNCSKAASFKWDFGDETKVNDLNTNTITNQTHTYILPGTYTVSLSVTSNCGTDVFTKEICIEPEITPTFSVDNEEGCIPFALSTTNDTDESELCSSTPAYEWSVDYESAN